MTASEALERLAEGNRRFVSNGPGRDSLAASERLAELTAGQNPFAIVLGCSDSRVPAEIVFDQGLGDLFVIRVAGNIVAPSQVGSVEFAAEQFGTPLVVVLGHSLCGAVTATLQALEHPAANRSPNLSMIVDRIRPSVEPVLQSAGGEEPDVVLSRAVRANIRASVSQLKNGSRIIEELVRSGGLTIVGAEYSLKTGVVDFFEGLPGDD